MVSDIRKKQEDKLSYDYLVIALGSETKFFDMEDIENYALTIKSWNDAIVIRNHVIHQLSTINYTFLKVFEYVFSYF
jgi:NADH:ubiquinone reductase (H+-translocating)